MTEQAAIAEAERIVSEWDRHTADIADSIEAITEEFRALGRAYAARKAAGGKEVMKV